MMLKNIAFLAVCAVLVALSFGAFYILGNYLFLIMVAIVVLALLVKVGKPKFGKKD